MNNGICNNPRLPRYGKKITYWGLNRGREMRIRKLKNRSILLQNLYKERLQNLLDHNINYKFVDPIATDEIMLLDKKQKELLHLCRSIETKFKNTLSKLKKLQDE